MFLDVININAADGANLVTLAAADTLLIVHFGTEVFNGNSAFRTGFDAFHAADTAGLALFSRLSALVVVFAQNCSFCCVEGEKVYKTPWTGFYAHLAGTALVGVDSCHAVTDENCLIGTDSDTVTEADTAVNAVLGTAEKLCGDFAGVHTAVFQLFLHIELVSLAHNGGNHGSHFLH